MTGHQSSHYVVLGISPAATYEEIKKAYRSLVVKCHPDKIPTELTSKQLIDAAHMLSLEDIDDEIDLTTEDAQTSIDAYNTTCHEPQNPSDLEGNGLKGPCQSPTNQCSKLKDEENISFHKIQIAYNILRDPIKRQEYDASLQRIREKETWASDGAIKVNLSELEKEVCSILYDEESEEEVLQTVYFYECRCGHTFEIVEGDLIEELNSGKYQVVYQCEGCSLSIKIKIDTEIG